MKRLLVGQTWAQESIGPGWLVTWTVSAVSPHFVARLTVTEGARGVLSAAPAAKAALRIEMRGAITLFFAASTRESCRGLVLAALGRRQGDTI